MGWHCHPNVGQQTKKHCRVMFFSEKFCACLQCQPMCRRLNFTQTPAAQTTFNSSQIPKHWDRRSQSCKTIQCDLTQLKVMNCGRPRTSGDICWWNDTRSVWKMYRLECVTSTEEWWSHNLSIDSSSQWNHHTVHLHTHTHTHHMLQGVPKKPRKFQTS